MKNSERSDGELWYKNEKAESESSDSERKSGKWDAPGDSADRAIKIWNKIG